MSNWMTAIGLSAGLSLAALVPARQSRPAAGTEYPPELIEQLELVRTVTARFQDHRVALEEGFERFGGDSPLMGEHWYRRDRPNETFDIGKPSVLQYLPVGDERILVGVAYTVYRLPGEPLPEGFVGGEDLWHIHDLVKIARAASLDRPLLRWVAERRIHNGKIGAGDGRTELTMVHAWVWLDNPDGVFAQDNRVLPYLRAGLPPEYAAEASADAAFGVSLLSNQACDFELRRLGFMAGVRWRQRRTLRAACSEAAGKVRTVLATDPDAATFNAAAAEAWRDYLQVRQQTLTPQQVERLGAGIEFPMGQHGHHPRG
ncbi:MAG: hypothetical protein ACE5HV_12665 [Acidobacteriota bacterium]